MNTMYLDSFLASSTPVWGVFLLGLLTAISPCPLATNITAVGFISKEIEHPRRIFWNGLLYSFGRVFSYMLLGIIVIPIVRSGASLFPLQKMVTNYGELLLPPVLLFIGFFMLFGDKLQLPSFGFGGNRDKLKKRGGVGAFLLGALFALAFCPTSAFLYFGMLIPLAVTSSAGYLYPFIFAIGTALPVIVVAWILAYSMSSLGTFYSRIQIFQKWFNRMVALAFIAVGFYYGLVFYV